jgi:hypothetical protein
MCSEPFNLWVIVEWMHDGAPAYFSRAVRDVPNNTYHDRRISRGWPTAWPSSSSGFLPVSTPKTLVYAAPVDIEDALHHRAVDACKTIRNCPAIFERMRPSMMRRVEACIECHGGHFEHLL